MLSKKDFKISEPYHGECNSLWHVIERGKIVRSYSTRQGGRKAAEEYIERRIKEYKPRKK